MPTSEAGGDVSCSGDSGGSWQSVGATGGQPAAFDSAGDELYVALHDGTIKRSADGGENLGRPGCAARTLTGGPQWPRRRVRRIRTGTW